MKNKQHKYILKAFLNSKIPSAVHSNFELMALDSVLGGYCTRLIKHSKFLDIPTSEIISMGDKNSFSELINQSTGIEKDELVVYYQLVILVESILLHYR